MTDARPFFAPVRRRFPLFDRVLPFYPILLLALSGCAVQQQAADPATVAEGPTGPWFCEPAIDGGWDCTDDPAAVANPLPSRSLASVLNRASDSTVNPGQALVVGSERLAAAAPAATGLAVSEEDPVEVSVEAGAFVPSAVEETAPATPVRGRTDLPEQSVALLDLPSDFFAVQVLAMSSPTSLERFFDTLGIDSLAAAEVEVNGVLRYVLLLGVYEELAAARQAAANLPESLAGEEPWIRRLGGLQAAMRRANRRREG